MKNMILLSGVLVVLSYQSNAIAQTVSAEEVRVVGISGAPRMQIPKTIWANPGDANLHAGKQSPAGLGRSLRQNESSSAGGSGRYYEGPYPQYNPYQFRW